MSPAVARHHNCAGEQPVGAGVGGIPNQVEHPSEDAIFAEERDQLAAQRLGRARGKLIGHPVLRRVAPSGAIRRTSGASSSISEQGHAGVTGPRPAAACRSDRPLERRVKLLAIGDCCEETPLRLGNLGDLERRQV